MTNTNTARRAAVTTEIVNAARTCTGVGVDGVKRTIAIGDRVTWRQATYEAGWINTGWRTGVVTKIGRGTETGMYGTTAIVEIAPCDDRATQAPCTVPARLLG